MQHNAVFHQGLQCLPIIKTSWTETHHNYINSTCYAYKYTIGSPLLTVSICMGNSISIQRAKCWISKWNLPVDEVDVSILLINKLMSILRSTEVLTDKVLTLLEL